MQAENQPPLVLSFEEKGEFLYVHIKGEEDTYEAARIAWTKIAKECHSRGYKKVLVEEDIATQLSILDMHKLTSEFPEMGFLSIKIAFVDLEVDQTEGNDYGATVSNNRGVLAKVFANVEEAEKWLNFA